MKNQILINMEYEMFKGNVLDIGFENYGIVYNIYKKYNDNINLEYISGKENKENIEKEIYDNCIMFFSLSKIWLNNNKKNFIRDVSKYLKKNGILHIWDIDKGYKNIFNSTIKVLLPDKKIKKIELRDFNILKDNSKESILKLIKEYFNIIDIKASDGMYYIKAKKAAL